MAEQTNIPNNTEIDKALKEFEAKNSEQTQKVPEGISTVPQKKVEGITFETDSYKAVKFYNETDTPKMVKLVMKFSSGAIKEQKQAEYVLFVIVLLIIGISVYLLMGTRSVSKPPVPSINGLPVPQGQSQ